MADAPAESPIRRLINAIRKRAGAGTADEAAGAGKDASQAAADMLPGAVMPHGALEAQRRRQALLDQIGRE